MVYQLLLSGIQNACFDWRSTGSLAVSQGIFMFACSLLIGGNLKRAEPKPVKMTSQTHEYRIFQRLHKNRPCLKTLKWAPLGNMLIFMYNDFQQLFCKIVWENWPVVKLVNANELFFCQSPYYMSDCIWHKNEDFCEYTIFNIEQQFVFYAILSLFLYTKIQAESRLTKVVISCPALYFQFQ